MGNKKLIPDGWTEYIPVGRRIPGTRFIAFKVPLKEMYDNRLAPWQRFSPADLIKEVEKQNEELGLIVDLTCTMRYYSPEDLPNTVMYSKIFTEGQVVPSNKVITQFKSTVRQYLSQNSGNDKLVGVHCTHGLNRTGYLVCRYLIDMLRMEPKEAVERFNSSRGHNIERINYINDLLYCKPRSNANVGKPQDKRRSSGKNVHSLPPPCPEEQPQNYSRTHATPRRKPQFHTPPSMQPSLHQQAGQVMGPQRGNPHSRGRCFSNGPRMPAPGFPHPHMPGPRHSLPQFEHNPPHYFRGPYRQTPPPQRPFHQHYDVVNGAPPEDGSPPYSAHSNHSFHEQGKRAKQHGSNPYQRHPKPAQKKKPKKQWQ